MFLGLVLLSVFLNNWKEERVNIKCQQFPMILSYLRKQKKRAHCEAVHIVLLEFRYCSHFSLLTWHCIAPSGMGQLNAG